MTIKIQGDGMMTESPKVTLKNFKVKTIITIKTMVMPEIVIMVVVEEDVVEEVAIEIVIDHIFTLF
jgi:hypothetical protein